MPMEWLLDNRIVVALASGALGIFLTLLTQRIIAKRGVFAYVVTRNRVGVSADDVIFGRVQLTWNDEPVANLYSSTVELRNESLNDYENVHVRVYTSDTILLTERTEVVGSIRPPRWSQEFEELIRVPPGTEVTQTQR